MSKVFKILVVVLAIAVVCSVWFGFLRISVEKTSVSSNGYDWKLKIGFSTERSSSWSGLFHLWKVWSLVEENYVDADKINHLKLAEDAARGMINGLGNRYSHFFDEKGAKQEAEFYGGEMDGLGIKLDSVSGSVVVTEVFENTPASKSKIKVGDIISSVNGKSTTGMDAFSVAAMFKGNKGDPVEVVFYHNVDGVWAPNRIRLVREHINLNQLITKQIGKIGVIKLQWFNPANLFSKLSSIATTFKTSGVEKIIVDFRGNPGGSYYDAAIFAGAFVKKGETLWEVHRAKGVVEKEITKNEPLFPDWPIVCLIDGESASAAEITVGSLRDLRHAIVLGKKSFGKSSMQTIEEVSGLGTLKMTVGLIYMPSGYLIDGHGIIPDIKVTPTEEDRCLLGRDTVLDKAVEILSK